MSDDTTDWRALREFAAVDLAASFALSWSLEGGSLQVDVDLCLAPDHPFYEKPRPAERNCYRPATLEFPSCTLLAAGGVNAGRAASSLGHGLINGLRRVGEGRYEMSGAFGRAEIHADRPILRLKEPFPQSKKDRT